MPENQSDAPVAALSVTLHPADRGIRVVVAGEIDTSTAADLEDQLTAAIGLGQPTVVVDLAGVTFLDSSGVAELVAAYHRAADAGVSVRVANCSIMVRRVLEVTGVWKALTRA
ncbi:MAG TPA: STAS domain-containing protein [Pilimelia sp.]|nr:STAS domain-containing protein [Pilimelia sp.]